MVVTPFGELALDDEIALQRFLDAHARRHHVYVPLLGIPGALLRSQVNGDWMLRHTATHIAIATQTGIDLSSADVKALALPGKWRTERELLNWSDLHSRHHLKIDRQLKVT